MKNLRKIFILILLIIPCAFIFNACSFTPSNQVYVTDIKETETLGNLKTYTIYYSNGTTSIFTIENGEDGKDGTSLSIEDIKEYCEKNNINFDSFLKEYLTIVQESNNIQNATAKAIQSAVSIWCEFPVSSSYVKDTSIACGAGIIYKMDEDTSYIITNYHVVYYKDTITTNKIAKKITIFQYGTSEYVYKTDEKDSSGYPIIGYGDGAVNAEYIGGSLNFDIAVLKVNTADILKYNANATAVTLANGYELSESAIAIGNPECEGFSVTSGIISVVSEQIEMTGADEVTPCRHRVMRIDTAVNGGNSGGGLFNIEGELIGIVNAKVIDSQIDNIAYALPYDNVTKVADNLIHYYEKENNPSTLKRIYLDITTIAENSRSIYNPSTNEITLKEDVVVQSVSYNAGNGLGYSIGLQAGDVIKSIQINDKTYNITRSHHLPDLLLTIREADKFIINVMRNSTPIQCGITTLEGVLASQLSEVK